MVCSEKAKLALFVVYIVSIVSALANPANLNFEDAYTLTQAANITTLLLLAYCKRSWGDASIAAALGVGFALRTTGSWRGGSRWDSLLVTIGMLIILKHAFFQVVPARVPHRTLLYLGFSCIIMPVLAALPHLLTQPQLDRDVLIQAAKYSSKAYRIKPEGTPDSKLAWTVYDPPTNTKAGVAKVQNTALGTTDVFVYFAGTENTANWKTNANILGDAVPSDWGCPTDRPLRTHKGFTKAFQSVATQLMGALETQLVDVQNPRIVFCGHSLGGSLATMAALYVACKVPSLRTAIAVVTFGAPQVGDGNFVKFFNDTIPTSVRVVNPMDPVPRVLNVQLVHVKGYYPVGTFTIDSTVKAHLIGTYIDAVSTPRTASILASLTPAAVIAALIGGYIAWKLART